MEAAARLERLERIVDRSGVAGRIEALLPTGVRRRQLQVRTLLVGMLLAAADGRPAHLTRVHAALLALGDEEQLRLGVVADWRHGSHLLSYRQTERTFALVRRVLDNERNVLRLDVVSENRRLRAFYEAAGFVHVRDLTGALRNDDGSRRPWRTSLYERACARPKT